MSRFARERMPPVEYLQTGYYEHWLHGLQTLLLEKNLLTEAEIQARMATLANARANAQDNPPAAGQ